MNRVFLALTAALLGAGSAQAQLIEPSSGPALRADAPARTLALPARTFFHGRIEGLPPADPQAPDLYRPDPKLYAGIDLTPNLGIETTFTNPDYKEGNHFRGHGPRLAQGATLGIGGINADAVARVTAPVDDQLSAFGTLGVAAQARKARDGTTTEFGPAASIGATYKLNSRQTATAEIPLAPMARKTISGSRSGYGATVKMGF